MPDFLDMLSSLGRGIGNVAAVPLTGISMIEAARHGGDPFAPLEARQKNKEEADIRQQQAILIRATAMQDPAARAYLTQNPDIAQKLFNLPTVAREEATPETLETGGYAVPGGPTTSTPPARLGLVPPQVTTAKTLQQKQLESKIQTQATLGDVFKQLLGEVGGQTGPAAPGGGAAVGGAPGGSVNIGGTPMRPVPSISSSGGMGLSFQQAPPPLKINAPTAKRLGLASGGNYQGRSVLVTEPDTTAQTRFKQEWAGKVDTFAGEVEKSLAGIGSYNGPQAWMRTGKVALSIPDPQWIDFTKKADLLGSALMNVHVGARGSEGMMQHFIDGIIGATHQSSANVTASLKGVRQYLQLLAKGVDADDALRAAEATASGNPASSGAGGGGTAPEGWKIERVR